MFKKSNAKKYQKINLNSTNKTKIVILKRKQKIKTRNNSLPKNKKNNCSPILNPNL
jgi:hypothetical protein